jgi:hypothetical protein
MDPPSFSNRTSSSVRVKWAPPLQDNGSPILTYTLEMAEAAAGAAPTFVPAYTDGTPSARVQHLAPASTYLFRVRAANAVGAGAYSAVAQVATALAAPSPPLALRADVEGGERCEAGLTTSALLSWAPAPSSPWQAACVSYEVEAQPVPREGGEQTRAGARSGRADGATGTPAAAAAAVRQVCSAKQAQHRLAGLAPGGVFSVRMRSVGADGAGHGEWSAPVTLRLPAPSPPPTPPHPHHEQQQQQQPGASLLRQVSNAASLQGDEPNDLDAVGRQEGRQRRRSKGGRPEARAPSVGGGGQGPKTVVGE